MYKGKALRCCCGNSRHSKFADIFKRKILLYETELAVFYRRCMILKNCGFWKDRSGRSRHPNSVLSAPHFFMAILIAFASSLLLAMGASTT